MSQETYLTREGEGRLVKPLLLWISDVGRDDLLEREVVFLRLELLAQLLGLDRELAAHGVLDLQDRGVELVWRKGTHVASGMGERHGLRLGQEGVMYAARRKADHEARLDNWTAVDAS